MLVYPPWDDVVRLGLLKFLINNVPTVVFTSLFGLIVFFAPALFVGWVLYDAREKSKLYQLFLSIICGFLVPFSFIFIIYGMSLEVIGACLAAGVLGAMTSFVVTLKLIYYPFKENVK